VNGAVDVGRLAGRVLDEVERAVVGKRDALELVLLGLLADGHVLLDDFPGLAKTLIARSFAQVVSLRFARVQFTPDLMPSDVTGSSIYNQRLGDFEFRPGPVFTNLLLGDEINRSPPKTQAALLEAMQERQVTIDGVTRPAPTRCRRRSWTASCCGCRSATPRPTPSGGCWSGAWSGPATRSS
jgi:MoxR-like ATPase